VPPGTAEAVMAQTGKKKKEANEDERNNDRRKERKIIKK
jgi:hypothetical protein